MRCVGVVLPRKSFGLTEMLKLYRRLSLRNKLLITMMSMVVFLAGVMGLLIRFVIFPYLVHEMEGRGAAVARHLADSSRSCVLAGDRVSLTAMLMSEKALEKNIAYIIVTDQDGRLLAHTFTFAGVGPEHGPPDGMRAREDKFIEDAVKSITPASHAMVEDIVVPVTMADRRIGTIRLGIDKRFIQNVVRRLRLFHLGFVGLITLLGLAFSIYLSKIITRPITSLTKLVGRISSGDFNACITFGPNQKCWEIMQCRQEDCPVRADETVRCWLAGSDAVHGPCAGNATSMLDKCKECRVYRSLAGDEITQLADAFNHMIRRLRTSESELRLSEQRYRLLFNRDPNPVFVVTLDSCFIVDANDRAAQKYGYTKSELLGMRFTDLGFEEDSPHVTAAFSGSDHLAGRCSLLPRIRHRIRTGPAFWVNVNFCDYEHAGRRAVIATTTDITEIVDTEAKLIQAGKMATLGEMSAGMAHELNQPLNAIRLGSDFLQTMAEMGKPVPEEDLAQVAQDLGKEVDRASEIINHLRAFGRKSDISRHKIDLNVPIKGALTILGQQLKVHSVDVILELDESLPPVLADENRIEQVLINLINNARDALDSRRERGAEHWNAVLAIRSYAENDQVVVTVGDNGPGIPDAIRERVFEPFFTTKAVGKGTGLGLSISYGIVRDFEGAIDFGTEEGVGTVFKMTFPKASEET